MNKTKWKVQVVGEKPKSYIKEDGGFTDDGTPIVKLRLNEDAHPSNSWEISVIREDCGAGRESYGWFGKKKILISHNGGHCNWPIPGYVYDKQLEIAHEVSRRLNNNEDIEW